MDVIDICFIVVDYLRCCFLLLMLEVVVYIVVDTCCRCLLLLFTKVSELMLGLMVYQC